MVLIALNPRPEFESNEKLNKKLHSFTNLINELKKKPLSENVAGWTGDATSNGHGGL